MQIRPLGDRAIVIRLGDAISEAMHQRVRAVCERLDRRRVPGMVEYVPAYASVTVHYDPLEVGGARDRTFHRFAEAVRSAVSELDLAEPPPARTVEIPVRYGGEPGPDLPELARHHGLSEDEVVRIHSGVEYLVHMIGFAPGFPYLGGLPDRIATPRRATPRTRVPAGSVGIGGSQTGVYPIESPGGWHLIGRTPLALFTPEADPPTLLRAGDRVRFRPVSGQEYRALGGHE